MDTIMILRAAEKLVVVAGGVLSLYLGYSLFIKGISGRASLKAQHNQANLQLLNAAPGIFFALFGMVVLGLSLWRQTTVFLVEPVPAANVTAMEWPGRLPSTAEEADAVRRILAEAGFETREGVGSSLEPPKGAEEEKYRILRLSSHGSGLSEQSDSNLEGNK